MFLTQRKRDILRALNGRGLDLDELMARFGYRTSGPIHDELRDLRSLQLVRLDGRLWELTERGRRKILHDQQLELRGISA